MNRKVCFFRYLVIALAVLLGACSSSSTSKEAKKAAPAPDKIQGKIQLLTESSTTTAADAALNAGGEKSIYLWEGTKRYRLFLKAPYEFVHGQEYTVEGVNAQKLIDEIGDPEQGKGGYPLAASCDRVVRTAWPGLPFDVSDGNASLLRTRIKRYPARAVFLVTKADPATPAQGATDAAAPKKDPEADEANLPEVSVAADKQKALLVEGPTVLTAPLWERNGGTVSCKVVVDSKGKIADLESGTQLCEAVPWAKFTFQPTTQKGKPARVKTEVEIKFEARK